MHIEAIQDALIDFINTVQVKEIIERTSLKSSNIDFKIEFESDSEDKKN